MPNVQGSAERLFEHDEVFRELCDEYQACSEATTRLEGAPGANRALLSEYQALRLRLEGEVLRRLAEQVGS